MTLFLLGLGLLLTSALFAFLHRSIAAWGGMLGASLALFPTLSVLFRGTPLELSLPWSVPLGSFSLGIDPLSAFFLLPTLGLSIVSAFYGTGYLKADFKGHWCFFNLLVATMALVLTARNGMLFLMAWEGMAIASFLLVTTEHERPEVQRAGWIYLVATHLGTAFLLFFFTILAQCAGSLDFSKIELLQSLPANELFLLALVGFGMKAGFLPLHVWLPEAHPAAPSHVSALMSGVMIKTGIYGLVRTLTWLGLPQAWWGYLLIGIGLSSGILGVLFALAQHDLKRLLAYHSVENIGIIALGLGIGTLGVATHSVPMAVLGFGGGLFHVLNHALFKGLLFLGAGSVQHETKTLEIDRLGGLLKSMPWTGYSFLVGALAISGLPPLNGFASELLIYAGAFRGLLHPSHALLPLAALVGLALIGGLATACFTKAFGIVFLGEAREALPPMHENLRMKLSMGALALACFLAAFLALPILKLLLPAIAAITGWNVSTLAADFPALTAPLHGLLRVTLVLGVLLLGLFFLRRSLLSHRSIESGPTWGCGYAFPEARMQYTASSFAKPFVNAFSPLLAMEQEKAVVEGPFPAKAHFATHPSDPFNTFLFRPLFRGMQKVVARLRWIQGGNLQVYILYIALTLLVLMIWKLG